MKERIQKLMAHAGVGSRRACEELIRDGRVKVNGKKAVLGQKADPTKDVIFVDGKPIGPREAKCYYILNKPYGYITTVKDQFGRKSVLDLMPNVKKRIYPVGRLDYDSEGLVFLTNDGKLAHKVMHPSFEIPKTYVVEVQGKITMDAVYRLRTGVNLEDGRTAPAKVRILQSKGENSVFELTIIEGRNRQIRRMCQRVGYEVQRLTRIAIGPLSLTGLASGQYRSLTKQEIKLLQQAVSE